MNDRRVFPAAAQRTKTRRGSVERFVVVRGVPTGNSGEWQRTQFLRIGEQSPGSDRRRDVRERTFQISTLYGQSFADQQLLGPQRVFEQGMSEHDGFDTAVAPGRAFAPEQPAPIVRIPERE